MAEDYDPFAVAEDAYDPFAAADDFAPAPAAPAPPPALTIDASQIAAALAQDAAALRGELESKTKRAVEMQQKRDAEAAARCAREQAAAAATAAEARAGLLGGTELTAEGVATCIEDVICAVLRWPPPGGLARWTVSSLTPWLDAPAAEVKRRIAQVDAHELEELLDVRARLARAPDAARRLTAAPSRRRGRGGWDAAANARVRQTEPGSFREAAAGLTVAEFVGSSRRRFRLLGADVVPASSRSRSSSSSSSSSSSGRRSRSPRRRRQSRSPPRRSRYDTAPPPRRRRSPSPLSPRRSPRRRSRSRSLRRETKRSPSRSPKRRRSRFDEPPSTPRVVSRAAGASREVAALAALSDGALRDQWPRVVKAAVLEVLAEAPPHGSHWRIADVTGRIGASRRALLEGIARVAPARAAARRVLVRLLEDGGRFQDISGGSNFANFARKQPYLRVAGHHPDAAVFAVLAVENVDEEGEADEARVPLAVGDRTRFKMPDRSVRKGVVTAVHRGDKYSIKEEGSDVVHRLPATAVKRASSRSPRPASAAPAAPASSSRFSPPAPAPSARAPQRNFSNFPAAPDAASAAAPRPRRASKFSDAPPARTPVAPAPRVIERRAPPPASPERARTRPAPPPPRAPKQSRPPAAPRPPPPKVPERPPPATRAPPKALPPKAPPPARTVPLPAQSRTVPVPVPRPAARAPPKRTVPVPVPPKPAARKKAKGMRPPRCADFEMKTFGQLMAEKKK